MTVAVDPEVIRAAEAPLLAAEPGADSLMRQAAAALATAVQQQLDYCPTDTGLKPELLICAGGGGNGGDGLYAAALLREAGFVTKVITWHPEGRAHMPALRAAVDAGCVHYTREDTTAALASLPRGAFVLVDAIQGLGSTPCSDAEAVSWAELAAAAHSIVAVDVPTGVCAATGAAPPPAASGIQRHVSAQVTVTFGALRTAHAISLSCGQVLCADLTGPHGQSLTELTLARAPKKSQRIYCYREVTPAASSWPSPLKTLTQLRLPQLEPAPEDHKHSGGVVGIAAGSAAYPGAAVLACGAAVLSTPAMVRYAGPAAAQVLAAYPEVVAHPSVTEAGEVAAWVCGPGLGTDSASAATLEQLLRLPKPLLLDADALTLLATHPELQQLVRERRADTLLTPHTGEFLRLMPKAKLTDTPRAVRQLATHLGARVLLKGRKTLIASPEGALTSVDAGHSWAATAGSGDVLSGLIGAFAARSAARNAADNAFALTPACVAVHARAAWLAATTEYGPAPVSASLLLRQLRSAIALLSKRQSEAASGA